MLLKIYLAGLLLSFLFNILYYRLVVTDSLVIDIVAALIITTLSWAGVFLFIISIKGIIIRAKEKKEMKRRAEDRFIYPNKYPVEETVEDPIANSVSNPIKGAIRLTRDQLN